jgi:thiol:disulfide interchange protein DsbD
LVKPLDQIEVTLYYQVCKEVCISAAEDLVFRFRPDTEGLIVGETTEADLKSLTEILLPIENKERLKAELATASSTLWTLVLLGFLGGLVALFTP